MNRSNDRIQVNKNRQKSRKAKRVISLTAIALALAATLFCAFYFARVKQKCDQIESRTPLLPTIDFIQGWYARSLNESDWEQYTSLLKQSGFEGIILQTSVYDSAQGYQPLWEGSLTNSDDRYSYTLERLLTAADKHDLNVYIGTYGPQDWWKSNYDDEYISTLADVTNAVFKAVTARYSSHPSMKGWYFTPEMYVNDKGYEDAWAKLLNLTISGIERYGNNLPMIFSPYCNDYSSGCQTAAESFTRLLRKVNFRPSDVFAPQDGFGALKKDVSAAELSKRYDFVKSCREAAKSADVNFWLNCELFTNSANEYASKNRMIGQFKLADVFCEKTICFSFAHYAFRSPDKTLLNDFKSILTN